MQTHSLIVHPASPPDRVGKVTVRWGRIRDGRVMLRYRLDGCEALVVPSPMPQARAEELWTSTCCELFLCNSDGTYREYNFSPSGQWAAYAFSGYRTRIGDLEPRAWPEITIDRGASVFTLTVFLPEAELAGAERAMLSMVVKELGGRLSYWAARHGAEKPDFHNPACFVLPVP